MNKNMQLIIFLNLTFYTALSITSSSSVNNSDQKTMSKAVQISPTTHYAQYEIARTLRQNPPLINNEGRSSKRHLTERQKRDYVFKIVFSCFPGGILFEKVANLFRHD